MEATTVGCSLAPDAAPHATTGAATAAESNTQPPPTPAAAPPQPLLAGESAPTPASATSEAASSSSSLATSSATEEKAASLPPAAPAAPVQAAPLPPLSLADMLAIKQQWEAFALAQTAAAASSTDTSSAAAAATEALSAAATAVGASLSLLWQHRSSMTLQMLRDSGIGKALTALKKKVSGTDGALAQQLLLSWKASSGLLPSPSQIARPSLVTPSAPAASAVSATLSAAESRKRKAIDQLDESKQVQPPQPGTSAAASSGPAEAELDELRTKVRLQFSRALDGTAQLDKVDFGGEILEVSAKIETEMFNLYREDTGTAYRNKSREVAMNLKDPRNPELKQRVMSQQISVHELLTLPFTELASAALKQQRAADKKWDWAERRTDLNTHVTATDAWRCIKCKERNCSYHQLQTDSADEPMTTFVQCITCGNRWRC